MFINPFGQVGFGNVTDPTAMVDVMGAVRSRVGGFVFPDGTTQATATLQGPQGSQGVQGPQGVAGLPGVQDFNTIVQNYGGTPGPQSINLSCPAGSVAIVASCDGGVSLVLAGLISPLPPDAVSRRHYLIPNVASVVRPK